MYADLCRRYADDPVAARVVTAHGESRGALALLSGLHYLVLAGRAEWDDPLAEHEEFLTDWVSREGGVQTNEPQRCWVLLPVFLHACAGADVVDVVELGASGGLLLAFDRYAYRYERRSWGDAPLVLRGEERTVLSRKLLAHELNVRTRVGIDRAPIDVTTDEGARRLESFVWAGQDARMARLRAAIDVARQDPPELVRGDVVDVLPRVLGELPDGGLTLVFQAALFEYLSVDVRERVRELLDATNRNLVFVSTGHPRGDDIRCWGMRIHRPSREREYVGESHYHGWWLDYPGL